MGNLDPVAFDIETNGLGKDAAITVAGIAHELGEVIVLNTAGRKRNSSNLERALVEESVGSVEVIVTENEESLLGVLTTVAHDRLNDDKHYLTAYNGETWNGGFDLPFVRSACVAHEMKWLFPNMAYADVFEFVTRFEFRSKQRITAQRFLEYINRKLVGLI